MTTVRFVKAGRLVMSLVLLTGVSFAQSSEPVAKWSFEEITGSTIKDSVRGTEDKIGGLYKLVPGVKGKGLRFDGYTTHIVRKAKDVPELSTAFTLDAWVALDTYPWNWVPIIDNNLDNLVGYFLGIDPFGHVGLQAGVNNEGWRSVTSKERLPLKRWCHIAGTFDENRGLALYINGEEVAQLPGHGKLTPNLIPGSTVDLVIGRVRQPLPPAGALRPRDAIWYSLDGIIDEVEIRAQSLSAGEIQRLYASARPPEGEVLPWPVFPAGPPGPGRFGAYPCTLKYLDTWDRMRRIGPDSDVVVRFDESPIRLVFWQGLNYIPAWVTENGKWYMDEFLEAVDPPGCNGGTDCEPFSDKQSRYSRVSVVESNDARAVVHWRYMLCESRNYEGSSIDPLTGWSDWTDEYWTIYPDGVAVRKQVLWSSNPWISHLLREDFRGYEWQEAIVILNAGHRPEDDINLDTLVLANMKGQTATYSWGPNTSGQLEMMKPPRDMSQPENANIQLVNLKSLWKPFQIARPPVQFEAFGPAGSYATWIWGDHFPVGQINSSGRLALTADRPSHASISHMYWDLYEQQEGQATKLLLDGLTLKPAGELASLAKSWVSPPEMLVSGGGATGKGFDPAQRAFVVERNEAARPSALSITLQASSDSPIVNPAIVVRNWDAGVEIRVNGKPMVPGKSLRLGFAQRLEGCDLIIWLQAEAHEPVRIELEPMGK